MEYTPIWAPFKMEKKLKILLQPPTILFTAFTDTKMNVKTTKLPVMIAMRVGNRFLNLEEDGRLPTRPNNNWSEAMTIHIHIYVCVCACVFVCVCMCVTVWNLVYLSKNH